MLSDTEGEVVAVMGGNLSADSESERQEFIALNGWEVGEEPAMVISIVIPEEFDELYNGYNDLQKAQGFDLSDYRGKVCTQYSYDLTNYPDAASPVRLNLVVYKGDVIGADISSMTLGGFVRGVVDSAT